MLHATPKPTSAALALVDELARLRAELHDRRPPKRWLVRLRRMARGSVASSSVSIEGFHVSVDTAASLLAGDRRPMSQDEEVVAAYGRAMDHVVAMGDDPHFKWNLRVLLDLHFDLAWPDAEARPGRLRNSPMYVTGPDGLAVYTAPPADEVPGLMRELVNSLRAPDASTPPVVRAAMAHLRLVSIHPFGDGNGRASRVLQSLVLALDGQLAPELASVEEYLAAHTQQYYDALQVAHGAIYDPSLDAAPWVQFCLQAHVATATLRIEQLRAATRRWATLEDLVETRRWPDRLTIALEQALTSGLDRAAYVAEADVSDATASADLRRLVDAGFLVSEGAGRSTRYGPSDQLRELVR